MFRLQILILEQNLIQELKKKIQALKTRLDLSNIVLLNINHFLTKNQLQIILIKKMTLMMKKKSNFEELNKIKLSE